MKDKNIYTGSKVENQFTAYLQSFIRGKRRDYLKKKIQISNAEEPSEELGQLEYKGMSLEMILEMQTKEAILIDEVHGSYPNWNELSDQRLVEALLSLREEERCLIYQHVFEEKSFDEMSRLNGMTSQRCKGVYYYAIQKIRKRMGGGSYHEF